MTGIRSSSLTKKILKHRADGLRGSHIAKILGCSSANVTRTLQRHGTANYRASPLTPEHIEFIQAEANKSHVPYEDMARALLMDYVTDLIENVSR